MLLIRPVVHPTSCLFLWSIFRSTSSNSNSYRATPEIRGLKCLIGLCNPIPVRPSEPMLRARRALRSLL